MTEEYTPRDRALDRIARSIAQHQAVKREGAVGSTCRNRACNGVIFLTLNDRYNHQAVVLANDLSSELQWQLDTAGEDAAETGQLPTEEVLASIRSENFILAPSAAPEADLPGKDNR